REQVRDAMFAAFEEALVQGQEQGQVFPPEGVEHALDRLESEDLELVLALGRDPRVRAVEWAAVESPFEWTDPAGRTYAGTIDALGRAREHIEAFGAQGRQPVAVAPGERVLVDWKF